MDSRSLTKGASMKEKIHPILINAITGLVIVPFIWVTAWFTWPNNVPITWADDGKFIPAQAEAGDWVQIYRDVRVHEKVVAHITREFQQKTVDGALLRVEALPVDRIFEVGQYKQFRPFKTPCALTKGKWQLVTELTYSDTLGRQQKLTPPILTLEITKNCKGYGKTEDQDD